MLDLFLEGEKELVDNEKKRILTDEENEIEAQEDLLKKRKKELIDQKKELQEDEESFMLELSSDDELLIEKDDEEDGIDMDKLKESLKIIEQTAEELGMYDDEQTLGDPELEEDEEDFYVPTSIAEVKKPYTGKRTVIKLGRKARYNWFKSRAAIAYARSNEDPLFAKLTKANKTRREMLEQIKRKYDSKASVRAKELMKKKK